MALWCRKTGYDCALHNGVHGKSKYTNLLLDIINDNNNENVDNNTILTETNIL